MANVVDLSQLDADLASGHVADYNFIAAGDAFPFGDVTGCCSAVPGGGHVVTLTISASAHEARVSDTPYNHYSILATIQDGWNLGCLNATCNTSSVPRMTDLVGPNK